MRNIIGPRVRQGRLEHSPPLTQEELANILQTQGWDVSRNIIAKIEIGIRQVTDIELIQLAGALGVPVSWLFGEDE
ncbi:MAG: helix-turn-helix transcriptional regulator [Deltaproteobacteria bacterium]|nr:helix-turn-helix transcriptional regulator [Deltaproteobacteria bacterium]